MRLIFTKPIELDYTAIQFQFIIAMSSGITEQELADRLDITRRDVRKIAERFNKRKYLNCDNTVKYHIYNKMYHQVFKDTERANYEVSVRKWNTISALTTYKIYLEDMGKFEDDDKVIQLSMIDNLVESIANKTIQEIMEMEVKQ